MTINGLTVHDWEDYEFVVDLTEQMEISEADMV